MAGWMGNVTPMALEQPETATTLGEPGGRDVGIRQRTYLEDGWLLAENATIPPEWRRGHVSVAGNDALSDEVAAAFDAISLKAVVAFEIGVDERGGFMDARTGNRNREVSENYSRMKHGDLDAVNFFAGHLAAKAVRSARFVSFFQDAVASERVVYGTTASVFNVPSASNLLLRTTAAHLNILLAKQGLAPVVIAEQTRLSDDRLGYFSRSVREIRSDASTGRDVTLVPDNFRDQSVLFLDDLFNSGNTIGRAHRRLQKAGVADTFYLLAAKMDSQVVGASGGVIEEYLNATDITGSLESITPMLKRGNFVAVQKLLSVVFNPNHTDKLPRFLQEMPADSILKLYAAAANEGFRQRLRQLYLPSMLVFETVLQDRGVLNAEGFIIGAAVDFFAVHL